MTKIFSSHRKILWVTAAALAVTAAFIAIAVAAKTGGSPRSNPDSNFCISCHEMESTVYKEFQKTSHFKNPSGMRASCQDCHVPQGILDGTLRKLQAGRELWAKWQGTIDTPEKFEDRRLALARRVWDEMAANNSAQCRSCHVPDGFDYGQFKKADGAKRMEKGLAEGQTCINCHKGIAHVMPDLSLGYKAKFKSLTALASKENPKKGQTAHTLSVMPLYLSADDTKKSGKLLPATALHILDKDGDRIRVRLDGWQQDGVDAMIYALQGKRIFSAALGKPARTAVERKETMLDHDTDLTWHRVSLTCWVDNKDLVKAKEALWEYGSEMHSASCSPCHSATPAAHFTANQWMGSLKSMSRNTNLTKGEYRFLLKYLQFHAKDTGGEGGH